MIIYSVRFDYITEHLGPDANVGVDILAGYEFGVPGNGVVETCQFLIEPLLVIVLHWMINGSQEYLDLPSAPVVVPVRFIV